LMSCQKLQMWHPTSLYGFRLKGITGMKQNVNHSQRLDTLFGLLVYVCGRGRGEEGNQTYRPLKFPQFWHCTVMCSAPLSADVKARVCVLVNGGYGGYVVRDVLCVPQVKKKNMVAVYCALCWRAASPR
jgi:hypothetical protein